MNKVLHRKTRNIVKTSTAIFCIVILIIDISNMTNVVPCLIFVSWVAFIVDIYISYLIIKLNLNIISNGLWRFQNDYNIWGCFVVKFLLIYAWSTGGGVSRGNEIALPVAYIGLIVLLVIDFWWHKREKRERGQVSP